jgi:hypothetical protein
MQCLNAVLRDYNTECPHAPVVPTIVSTLFSLVTMCPSMCVQYSSCAHMPPSIETGPTFHCHLWYNCP